MFARSRFYLFVRSRGLPLCLAGMLGVGLPVRPADAHDLPASPLEGPALPPARGRGLLIAGSITIGCASLWVVGGSLLIRKRRMDLDRMDSGKHDELGAWPLVAITATNVSIGTITSIVLFAVGAKRERRYKASFAGLRLVPYLKRSSPNRATPVPNYEFGARAAVRF